METTNTRFESKDESGNSKTICVEKVENGYVITIDKYKASTGEGDNYKSGGYTCKKYISKENPFPTKEQSLDLATVMSMA